MKKIALVFACVALTCVSAKAELIGINNGILEYVNQINSMNDGRGIYHTTSASYTPAYTVEGHYHSGLDSSAYSPYTKEGDAIFIFCMEPSISTVKTGGYMTLSYDAATGTSSTTYGNTLSLASATIYAWYATGMLNDFCYEDVTNATGQRYTDSWAVMEAVREGSGVHGWGNWETNKYLQQLLEINSDTSYWLQNYNPTGIYDEIGDYSVFVMNNWFTSGADGQDFLYLVSNPAPSDQAATPEPASMLIFGVGLAGAALARRRMKNAR